MMAVVIRIISLSLSIQRQQLWHRLQESVKHGKYFKARVLPQSPLSHPPANIVEI
jgi:hypothetical protein